MGVSASQPSSSRPGGEAAEAEARALPRDVGEAEDPVGEQVAGDEIDVPGTELLDEGGVAADVGDLQERGRGQQQGAGHATQGLGDDREHRQQIDEPEAGIRFDQGVGEMRSERSGPASPTIFPYLATDWITSQSR